MRAKAAAGGNRWLCAALIGLLALAACETGPVYKPRGPGERVGYTDEQLAANRYRVTFSGNTATPRAQVENYLLRRAAEITLQAGYTHFIFDTRDTEAKTYYRTDFDPWAPWGSPLGPRRYAWYWANWPATGTSFPVTRYEAYAEIVMLTAEQAAKDPLALSAADVLQRLGGPPQS
ncbi:MAG: CC0125/CC1285 family lipoprotein [Alphaproteobacteria bacterium]